LILVDVNVLLVATIEEARGYRERGNPLTV
jgi:hypothetical protein